MSKEEVIFMEKEILENFGKRIRRIRLDNGYTQEHISAECGISLSYYSLIENSKKKSRLRLHYPYFQL